MQEAEQNQPKRSFLVAEHLGKAYGNRPVVRDVSLYLQQGEVVGLLGPNGAGKTTCFYMISGLIRPDYGTIRINDYDITTMPMYKRARLGLGYLPQEASVFRGLSVEDNIMAILEVSETKAEKRQAMLEELLGEFSLTHIRKTQAVALSGGERRRCEIARALASRPTFILLDEPLAGIDPIAIDDIRTLIVQMRSRGIGILITDHNVREALDLIDRAYIMHEGTVLTEGSPEEIINNPDVKRVYLGDRF